jgi:Asp-tRNA(Asn)/Glu-tRNA(Gln) amidotransferase B subunit
MELAAYLAEQRTSYAAFARVIGSKHARTVERYAKGKQRPNAVMMAAIVQATGGRVTPNDFFGVVNFTLPPTGSAAAHD